MPPVQETQQNQLDSARNRLQRLQTRLEPPPTPEPRVSASQLTERPRPITTPTPRVATQPTGLQRMVGNVQNNVQAQLDRFDETQRQIDELRQTYGTLAEGTSLQELYDTQLDEAGVPQNVQELQDINLQLADMQTASNLQQTQIAGAEGQTFGQAQREITQEQQEAAVRQAGLAARAAVLSNNIETAQALASQAASFAFQDRKLRAENMINQISTLQTRASQEQQRLLEQEKRQYETELAQVQQLETAVANAIASGASQREIAAMSSSQVPDAQKLQIARGVQARAARKDIELERQRVRAGIDQGWARIDLAEREFKYQQHRDKLAAELEALQNAGHLSEQQVQGQQKVERALGLRDLIQQVRGHAGFNLSVGSLGSRVANPFEFGLVGQAYNYLSGQGEGFDAIYDQLTESLTLDNLDKMSGVLTDKDIEILRNAATRLRKTTTEEEFLNTLREMEQTVERTILQNGITSEQAQFYFDVPQEDLLEAEQLWEGLQSTPNASAVGLDTVAF